MTPEVFGPGIVSFVSNRPRSGQGEPEMLDAGVFGEAGGPCVSPDNRVLIVHARKDGGFGNWDLYASFRDAAGNWGTLVNMGSAVNTEAAEAGASFSPDGKYIFFSRAGDIFWVSAGVLAAVRGGLPTGGNSGINEAALRAPRACSSAG